MFILIYTCNYICGLLMWYCFSVWEQGLIWLMWHHSYLTNQAKSAYLSLYVHDKYIQSHILYNYIYTWVTTILPSRPSGLPSGIKTALKPCVLMICFALCSQCRTTRLGSLIFEGCTNFFFFFLIVLGSIGGILHALKKLTTWDGPIPECTMPAMKYFYK